ncbi:hypothetical protein E5288_WYG014356 [Bos mutus]|uniref:Uncharacterized protein n=1 Tax=Bos mutus TaxID=72004 RepID=A0A6B0R7P5_9CETA|nr:hypothetical protein [Bos mutus]
MKTKDTYMKFSWLTVTENSMDKQHVCVVKHKKNIGGIDQEIIFPSIKEVVTSLVPTTEPPNDCLTDESITDTGSKKACLKDGSGTIHKEIDIINRHLTTKKQRYLKQKSGEI